MCQDYDKSNPTRFLALQRQMTENLERQLVGKLERSRSSEGGKGRLQKHRRSLSEERISTAVIQVGE